MPVPVPTLIRSSTFTLDDDRDENAPVPPTKNGKSIGKRIMAACVKRGAASSTTKSDTKHGLSVKKTISKSNVSKNSVSKNISIKLETSFSGVSVKNTISKNSVTKNSVSKNIGTPGSAYRNKFGVARKMPNFRSIHQKLFSNMESIDANHKRIIQRGHDLIMSPSPRCAVLRKSLENDVADKKTPERRTSTNLQEKKPAFTIGSTQKPLPSASKQAVNRFGFKKRINKIENIVGQKQPPVTLEKRKEQERNLIHGVRMNKRFMLQMEMRKNNK